MIRILLALLIFAMPAMADNFSNNQSGVSSCTIDIVGSSSTPITATANYSPITYNCSAGTYLPADGIECVACPGGKYCTGGEYSYNETTAQGATGCPSGYTSSATGSDEQSDCYRTCTTSDVAHATSVTGNVYSNGTKTCVPADSNSCATGYTYVATNLSVLAHCVNASYDVSYVVNGGNILPSGYTQLKYLESTGTQYIDTGIILNADSKIETKFKVINYLGNNAVFGASNGAYHYNGEISFFYHNPTSKMLVFEPVVPTSNASSNVLTQPSFDLNTDYAISMDKNLLKINYPLYSYATNWYSGYQGTRSVYMFATNRGDTSWIGGDTIIYYFKIYNNDDLVFNGIPARRNSDNVLGIYDTVSGTFKTNAGTGTFTAGPSTNTQTTYTYGIGATIDYVPTRSNSSFAGWCTDAGLTNCAATQTIGTTAMGDKTLYAKWTCNTGYSQNAAGTACEENIYNIIYVLNGGNSLPSGYTQLEYIESTGGQYIDTGVYLTANSQIDFIAKVPDTSDNHAFFGASNGAAYNNGEIGLFWYDGRFDSVCPLSNNSSTNSPVGGLQANAIYSIRYTHSGIFANGVQIIYFQNFYPSYTGSRTAYIFSSHREPAVSAKYMSAMMLYNFMITNNGTTAFNGIPARRNSDNVLGLYDTVSGTFKTNIGTGNFIAGPDGGTTVQTYTYGVGTTTNPTTTRSNSTFAGWCDNAALTSNCTTPKTIGTTATGDKTFYAKYLCDTGYSTNVSNTACDANTINIQWDDGNGGYTAGTCSYGGSITTPTTAPTKRGHVFTGWTFDLGN